MTLPHWLLKIPRWWASAVVIAAVLYLTLAPKPLPDNDIRFWEHTDKVVHALMMAGVYMALRLDIWRNRMPTLAMRLWLAVAVTAFGGIIELTQTAMGMGRGGSWGDLAADAVGAIAASVIPL